MNKSSILEDMSQLSELHWCPVPFQMTWSVQVLDVGLMAMTRAQLGARHCTHAGTPGFEPQALLSGWQWEQAMFQL